MASCKECLYYEVCPLGLVVKGKTGICLKFKNKADVAEVKHGEWLPQIVLGQRAWDCSECKTLGSPRWGWCPMCGAKMDGKEDA